MKCPILSASITIQDRLQGYQEIDCLKKECAWWNNTNDMCAVLQLSKSIYYIGIELPKIAKELTLVRGR